jgi:hypothetical protein
MKEKINQMKIPNYKEHRELILVMKLFIDEQFQNHVSLFEETLKQIVGKQKIPFEVENSHTDKFKILFTFSSDRPDVIEEDRHQVFQIRSNGKFILLEEYIDEDMESSIKNPVIIPVVLRKWIKTESFEKGFRKALKKYFGNKAVRRVLKKKKRK